MPVYTKSEARPLVTCLRCLLCGQLTAVAEGSAIPLCCWMGSWKSDKPNQMVPTLEHHLPACLEVCGPGCDCPCHEYRLRSELPGRP